jgi:hypothetical protein
VPITLCDRDPVIAVVMYLVADAGQTYELQRRLDAVHAAAVAA